MYRYNVDVHRYVIRIGGDLSPLNRIYFPNIALHVITSFDIMVFSCKAIFLKIYVRSDTVGIICFWGGISDKKNHKFNLEWRTVCESHWRRGHETREIRRATLLWNVQMLQGWTQHLKTACTWPKKGCLFVCYLMTQMLYTSRRSPK